MSSPLVNFEQAAMYERMSQAIQFMRAKQQEQPDLKTIAEQVQMSEYHFQRLFTRWVGVSPKRFLQYLTIEYTKQRIQSTSNLLDLTHDAGLSSPSRLHDLFVQLEAMSPGEYKAQAAGLRLDYGLHDSPFGLLLIAKTHRGICDLQFIATNENVQAHTYLQQRWPLAHLTYAPQQTEAIAQQLFNLTSNQPNEPLTLYVKGSNFQIQVWRALLNIPFASLSSYSAIAQSIGKPKAVRAVGTAIAHNPIACLIPCHRVLRQSGELGGYRWGLERKTALLAWEASQLEKTMMDTTG